MFENWIKHVPFVKSQDMGIYPERIEGIENVNFYMKYVWVSDSIEDYRNYQLSM